MTTKKLTVALDNVELTYHDIVNIANDMLKDVIDPVNAIVQEIRDKGSDLPVESIRQYMLRLQLHSYELAEPKDKATLKFNLSEALKDEKHAQSFLAADGTATAKESQATLQASDEIIIEALYQHISKTLQTKLDEVHRLIDTLKSILMSKMQEAKLSMNSIE